MTRVTRKNKRMDSDDDVDDNDDNGDDVDDNDDNGDDDDDGVPVMAGVPTTVFTEHITVLLWSVGKKLQKT